MRRILVLSIVATVAILLGASYQMTLAKGSSVTGAVMGSSVVQHASGLASTAIGTAKLAASGSSQPAAVSSAADCSQDTPDGVESSSANDTDNVDLQCGDQNAPDGPSIKPGSAASVNPAAPSSDTDNVQEQVGDQGGPEDSSQQSSGD